VKANRRNDGRVKERAQTRLFVNVPQAARFIRRGRKNEQILEENKRSFYVLLAVFYFIWRLVIGLTKHFKNQVYFL